LVVVERGARRWCYRNPDFLRWRGSRSQPNSRRLLCGAPKGFAWQRFVAIDDTIGAGHASFKRRCWYVWEADSRPGSGRPDVEARFGAIVLWLLVIHVIWSFIPHLPMGGPLRSRFVSFHQLRGHTCRLRNRSQVAFMAMAPKRKHDPGLLPARFNGQCRKY